MSELGDDEFKNVLEEHIEEDDKPYEEQTENNNSECKRPGCAAIWPANLTKFYPCALKVSAHFTKNVLLTT